MTLIGILDLEPGTIFKFKERIFTRIVPCVLYENLNSSPFYAIDIKNGTLNFSNDTSKFELEILKYP